MKRENIFLAVVAVGAVGFLLYKKFGKTSNEEAQPVETPTQTTQPAALNRNLVLKNGSRGNEVKELQRLLGVNADGAFGSITENALLKLKGVKQTSLNGFSSLPTLNQNILPNGTKLMANRSGAKLYGSQTLANGVTYILDTVYKTLAFGDLAGTIVAIGSDRTAYLISYTDNYGTWRLWVKTSEVQKI